MFFVFNELSYFFSTGDPDAPAYSEGGSGVSAGTIVGIVVGIVVLIAFTIILFWCFKERKLPGMSKYRHQKPVKQAHSHNGYTNSDYNYSKEPSLVSDAPSKKLYLEDQGIFPSIDSLQNNSLNGSATGLYSKKAPIANWNIHTGKNEDFDCQNKGRGRYHSEVETERKYLKNDSRGRIQSVGDSPGRRRREDLGRPGVVPPPPPINGLGNGPNVDRNDRHRNDQHDDGEMSGVKRRKQRMNQNQEKGDTKRPNSGIFENPDKEGYMYDYDGVKKLTSEGNNNEENKMLNELKRELERRQSVKEGKGENEEKVKKEGTNSQTKSDDAPGAPSSKPDVKSSKEKSVLPETGTIDKKYKAIDQQSEIGDPEMISNPLNRNNPAIRASVSELRGSTSPGTRKKKRRKSHKKYVKADPVSGKVDPYRTGDETSTEKPTDIDESFDRDSMYNDSFRLPKTGPIKDTPLPPEAMAPIFATDESTMQQYYPQTQYEPQNQLVYPVVGYDAFGNPVYGNPVPLSVAYSQPGYYVDQHGYPVNTQQQQQPMIPIQFQSPTDFHPGMPGYTSTPSNHISKHSPHHGRKKRTKSTPHDALAVTPGAPSPILPTGNILDEPRIPPPGTTLMNSGVDPRTGVKTSQVVWTDANPDPTDPTGDNPQITRQTIVRVTARDTEDGQLPQPPSASKSHKNILEYMYMEITVSVCQSVFISFKRNTYIVYSSIDFDEIFLEC